MIYEGFLKNLVDLILDFLNLNQSICRNPDLGNESVLRGVESIPGPMTNKLSVPGPTKPETWL